MSKKMQWLDTSLIESPVYYCLCMNKKQFKKALKHIGRKSKDCNFLNHGADATAHFFSENNKHKAITIVCLGNTKGYSLLQVHSLLVHEAVHIWQEVKLLIGEKDPSNEFEAYSIQSISQNLMEQYING